MPSEPEPTPTEAPAPEPSPGRHPPASRLIALAIVGSVSAVLGQRLLPRAPDIALLLAVVGAVGIVLWIFSLRGRSSLDTLGPTIGVAIVGGIAGGSGERLYDRAPGVLLGVAVLTVLVVATFVWRRRRAAGPTP